MNEHGTLDAVLQLLDLYQLVQRRRNGERTCAACGTTYAIGQEGAVHVVMPDGIRVGPLCPPCGVAVLAPTD